MVDGCGWGFTWVLNESENHLKNHYMLNVWDWNTGDLVDER